MPLNEYIFLLMKPRRDILFHKKSFRKMDHLLKSSVVSCLTVPVACKNLVGYGK